MLGCGTKVLQSSHPDSIMHFLPLFGTCGGKGTAVFRTREEIPKEVSFGVKVKCAAWASSLSFNHSQRQRSLECERNVLRPMLSNSNRVVNRSRGVNREIGNCGIIRSCFLNFFFFFRRRGRLEVVFSKFLQKCLFVLHFPISGPNL